VVEEVFYGICVNVVCPGGTIMFYHIQRVESRGVSEIELRV